MRRFFAVIALILPVVSGCNWLERNLGFSQLAVSNAQFQQTAASDEPQAVSPPIEQAP